MPFFSCLLLSVFLASGAASPNVSAAESFDSPLAPFVRTMIRTIAAVRKKNPPLSSDFAGLMSALSAQSPVLAENLENASRAELLQKMLDGMGSGIRRKISAEPEEKQPLLPVVYRGKTICDRRILYLPLHKLSEESAEQLIADCTAAARLAVKPEAALLDLRHAEGGTQESLKRILSVFTDGGYFASRPLAVLTSAQTSGAPELLAVCLEREGNTVTLGEAGMGRLFPEVEIEAAGVVWIVPVIAPEFRNIPPLPHRPMIVCPAGIPVDYAQLGDPDALRNDAALSRAADLLLSLSATKRKTLQHHTESPTP